MVEDIEELSPQNKLETFADKRCAFRHGEVHVHTARTTQHISRRRAVGTCSSRHGSGSTSKSREAESGGVEIRCGWIGLGIKDGNRSNQVGTHQVAITGAGWTGPGHAARKTSQHVKRESSAVKQDRVYVPALSQ